MTTMARRAKRSLFATAALSAFLAASPAYSDRNPNSPPATTVSASLGPVPAPQSDFAPGEAGPRQATTRPNIVFIMLDNFGYGELGTYGGGIIRGAATPQIDTLARDGFKLTNFNTEPICTVSRAALLTGRFPIRTGLVGNRQGPADGLTQWEITLAEMLKSVGYVSGYFGKWHLGDKPGRYPTDQGFAEWFGIPRTNDEATWTASWGVDPEETPPMFTMESKAGDAPRELTLYDVAERSRFDGEVVDHAIRFIQDRSKGEKPFLAFLSMTAGHFPVVASPQWDGATGKGPWPDVLAQTDAYVGQILKVIKDANIEQDTIVIFTADNGAESWFPRTSPTPPTETIGSPGPWRGSYGTAMEGGLRVPFLLRWPGIVPAGEESNEIVHLVDIFPTLACAVGAKIPDDRPIDGVNQWQFLAGKSPRSRRDFFPVYDGFTPTVIGAKWKDWKVHFVDKVTIEDPMKPLAFPQAYNLLWDPKESKPLGFDYLWVVNSVSKRVGNFAKSLDQFPSVPVNAKDPYTPAYRNRGLNTNLCN